MLNIDFIKNLFRHPTKRRHSHPPKPTKGSEILTEAANCCNVMCGKGNKRGVEGPVLLLVVQDFRFTAKKKKKK